MAEEDNVDPANIAVNLRDHSIPVVYAPEEPRLTDDFANMAESLMGSWSGDSYQIKQYAQGVYDYSSQYGSEYSISYTASNITGKPGVYPHYGDFPETYAMRTYGNWWKEAPSRVHEIQPQNLPRVPAHDFIVVYFEEYVIPEAIEIFETFNPGAIVRIWAYTISRKWLCLWECDETFYLRGVQPISATIFSPTLKKVLQPIKTIRLEFNHSRLSYFTAIDAVLLTGRSLSDPNMRKILEQEERERSGSLVSKLQSMRFRVKIQDNYETRLQDFFKNDLNKFIDVLPNETSAESQKAVELNDLPFEIILQIFSHLDLVSLFRVGQVSRYFYDVSIHPLLYSELNLKPYWHIASTQLILSLAQRATVLRKLDMSWCGLHTNISPTEFKKFIQQRGDTLTHLRLGSCKFLNISCIETVGIVCDNLKELTLRNYSNDPPILNFSCLANLKNLERLDLFQTVVESDLILVMLESNPKLKHLNLAFSGVNVNMDSVAQHIGRYNQQLISLDIWKSHYLSALGLEALSNCHNLEELDVGWCLREGALGNSLLLFLTNCPNIRKLFFAAVRGLTDADIENIAKLCPNLEQLDLMGVLGITTERYHDILRNCKNLKLLDLSFCDNIDVNEIILWAHTFKVQIKYGNVPMDFRY